MKHNTMAIYVRTRIVYSALAIVTIMFSMGKDLMAQTNTSTVVKNGSEQESDKEPISRGFPENHEFGFGGGHALSLEEQVA